MKFWNACFHRLRLNELSFNDRQDLPTCVALFFAPHQISSKLHMKWRSIFWAGLWCKPSWHLEKQDQTRRFRFDLSGVFLGIERRCLCFVFLITRHTLGFVALVTLDRLVDMQVMLTTRQGCDQSYCASWHKEAIAVDTERSQLKYQHKKRDVFVCYNWLLPFCWWCKLCKSMLILMFLLAHDAHCIPFEFA